jgi:uncharacterized protein (TIGR03067 family)
MLVFAAGAANAGPAEEAAQREHKRLQGTWRVISVEAGGSAIPTREYRGLALTFAAGKFSARRGEEDGQQGTYSVDPTKSPRQMDITRTNGPAQGRKQVAIYQLTGDLLKICSCEASGDRPTGFDTRDRPDCTLMVLRRVP